MSTKCPKCDVVDPRDEDCPWGGCGYSSGITLAFESKAPHKTPWLSIEFDEGSEPVALLAQLEAAGWKEDTRYRRLPPLDGRQEIHVIGPPGTDLFSEWNLQERRTNMRAIRALLREEGFREVPWHKLTLEDLL